MGTSRSPPVRVTTVINKWVRPIRRLADLTVGLTDLICSPEDLPEGSSRRSYLIRWILRVHVNTPVAPLDSVRITR
jgi:hypothetical protein